MDTTARDPPPPFHKTTPVDLLAPSSPSMTEELNDYSFEVSLHLHQIIRGSIFSVCARGNTMELVSFLDRVSNGSSEERCRVINSVDAMGYRPLEYAILAQHTSMVKVLLEVGGDLCALSNDGSGCLPLHRAAMSGSLGILDVLLNFSKSF